MTNARIERLTREALGPQKRRAYTAIDDGVLRALAIAILIVVVVVIASWPRDDTDAHRGAADTHHAALPEFG